MMIDALAEALSERRADFSRVRPPRSAEIKSLSQANFLSGDAFRFLGP